MLNQKVLNEAQIKISSTDTVKIIYEKLKGEIEKLKEHLNVNFAKRVGERAYKEYARPK